MDIPASEYELMIVDNGSEDGTVAVAEGFRSQFPNFRLMRNERNMGFPAAVNQAAGRASSPVLVLLNQDTTVECRWLSELLASLQRDPSLAAVERRIGKGPRPECTCSTRLGTGPSCASETIGVNACTWSRTSSPFSPSRRRPNGSGPTAGGSPCGGSWTREWTPSAAVSRCCASP